jgi:dTDP-D-glucose 4,6-dehydratase
VGKLSALGWAPKVPFDQGLRSTYEWYSEHRHLLRDR